MDKGVGALGMNAYMMLEGKAAQKAIDCSEISETW